MLIVGTGAVATFLAQRLSPCAGTALQFFGSPGPRLEALAKLGAFGPYSGVSTPELVASHEGWIVTVKTWQNLDKCRLLEAAPRPSRILVLQNGLEPESDWRGVAGATVERAVTTYGVRSLGPGEISGGEDGCLTLSYGSTYSPLLSRCGLSVREVVDMRSAVWAKLVVNASLNVVASLYDCTNGEVLQKPRAYQTMIAAAREVAELAWHHSIAIEEPEVLVESVARSTAENLCSTLVDLRRGLGTEYPSINGALLRLARELGLNLATLEELDRRFEALLSQARSPRETATSREASAL